MAYCKNCGAYIPSDDSKCDECGTMNGKTPLMRLQRAIKTNGSLDDIIEKQEIDNSPIATPKMRPQKQREKADEGLNYEEIRRKQEADLAAKFSDYMVDDLPDILKDSSPNEPPAAGLQEPPTMPSNAVTTNKNKSTNLVDSLDDIDTFDMLGEFNESSETTPLSPSEKGENISNSQVSRPVETVTTEVKKGFSVPQNSVNSETNNVFGASQSDNTNGNLSDIDDLDDDALNSFIEEHSGRNDSGALTSDDYSQYAGHATYEDYVNNAGQPESQAPLEKEKKAKAKKVKTKKPPKEKSPQSVPMSSDVQVKKKGNKIPIVLAILVVVIAVAVVGVKTGFVSTLFNRGENTTGPDSEVTTDAEITTVPVADAYPYAEVYQATGTQAAQAISEIVNGYRCGKILSASVDGEGKVTLKTDEWEVLFRVSNSAITKEAFENKSVMVVGAALYDTISAEKVYVYNSDDIIEIPTTEVTTVNPLPTIPSTVITEAPTEPQPTEAPTEAPTEKITEAQTTTTKSTTTKPTTTKPITTAIPTVSIQYISEAKAKQLMSSWRADGTQLGESNAYYGTIKSVSANGEDVTIKTTKFSIVFKSNDTINAASLVGKNILAVAKPQSNNVVRASQVYIY